MFRFVFLILLFVSRTSYALVGDTEYTIYDDSVN